MALLRARSLLDPVPSSSTSLNISRRTRCENLAYWLDVNANLALEKSTFHGFIKAEYPSKLNTPRAGSDRRRAMIIALITVVEVILDSGSVHSAESEAFNAPKYRSSVVAQYFTYSLEQLLGVLVPERFARPVAAYPLCAQTVVGVDVD